MTWIVPSAPPPLWRLLPSLSTCVPAATDGVLWLPLSISLQTRGLHPISGSVSQPRPARPALPGLAGPSFSSGPARPRGPPSCPMSSFLIFLTIEHDSTQLVVSCDPSWKDLCHDGFVRSWQLRSVSHSLTPERVSADLSIPVRQDPFLFANRLCIMGVSSQSTSR